MSKKRIKLLWRQKKIDNVLEKAAEGATDPTLVRP